MRLCVRVQGMVQAAAHRYDYVLSALVRNGPILRCREVLLHDLCESPCSSSRVPSPEERGHADWPELAHVDSACLLGDACCVALRQCPGVVPYFSHALKNCTASSMALRGRACSSRTCQPPGPVAACSFMPWRASSISASCKFGISQKGCCSNRSTRALVAHLVLSMLRWAGILSLPIFTQCRIHCRDVMHQLTCAISHRVKALARLKVGVPACLCEGCHLAPP